MLLQIIDIFFTLFAHYAMYTKQIQNGTEIEREEVAASWRRLHNVKLNNLQASSNIIKVMKSRRMRRAGHVGNMGEMRNTYKIVVG
jgi:hypothetical protein